jgi:hypothetical protein
VSAAPQNRDFADPGRKGILPVQQRRRRNAMKTVLVVAAVLGLSASAAFADCAGHKVNASVDVDKTITTASVATTDKQPRLPAEAEKVVVDTQKDAAAAE